MSDTPTIFPIPNSLLEIPNKPKKLYIRGHFPITEKYLCVIGARKHTDYGQKACEELISGLAGHSITIVSGLALGMDTVAHVAALNNKLPTIAFPGSGINDEVIAPSSHLDIAKKILDQGGCLISEYEPNEESSPWKFPERNRLMAGISDVVLVIECSIKSGTMITARLALDYNKTVCAVPGSIFSPVSEGTNYLIRSGAIPIRNSADILDALNLKGLGKENTTKSIQEAIEEKMEKLRETCSENELKIISALFKPQTRDQLSLDLKQPIHEINIALTLLELKEIIEEKFSVIYLKNF